MSGCIFCSIVAGDIPADVVSSTEHTVSFRDIAPAAQVHVLVVPRDHHRDIASLAVADPAAAADLLAQARQVAGQEGFDDFRLVFNTGESAGQTVFHAHGHVLAGPELPAGAERHIDAASAQNGTT
ncbi:HIT domain-containing protein [Aeromicrobium piscarium]|uniref:HIT domain-containing protein n=1 Tax=Aeromicrobium piscarium TaxID=2590901 RepID=A0A554S7S2_9ACTN|nr:HIT domain-containing protein [Aeromicrobium piscarium]TSD62392.1 HIT domain-containing protein [Aeromicrobium piscarium]